MSNLFLKVYGLNSPALGFEISGLEGLEPKSCGLQVLVSKRLWTEQSGLDFLKSVDWRVSNPKVVDRAFQFYY